MMWLMLGALAVADDIQVDHMVTRVTVFQDRARITREAKIKVPAGRSDLIFDELSLQLEEATLSAEGEGTAGATLLGIDVRRQVSLEDRDARVRELEVERRKLLGDKAVHQDTIARVDGESAFLKGLKPQAPSALSTDLFLADDAPAQLAGVSRQIGQDLRTLASERRAATEASADIDLEVQRIDRELNEVRGQRQPDGKRVAVGLDAAREGTITVRLTYVARGASWSPRYNARYSPQSGKVRLDLAADVSQQTGETWDNVQLVLSTASPSRGTSPPELEPFVLRAVANGRPGRPTGRGAVTAVEYPAARRQDLPGDGTRRRVALTSAELEAEVVHRVVPRRSENATLQASTVWSGSDPLLSGPVASYLGTAYVGVGVLPATAPGQPLDLSFGVDDRVVVERETLKDLTEGTRALGNTERRTWGYGTTVKNHTGKPLQLVLVDQVPASREADFEVTVTTTPETSVPADGVFEWKATVPVDGEQVFQLQYEVRWPTGQAPVFLD